MNRTRPLCTLLLLSTVVAAPALGAQVAPPARPDAPVRPAPTPRAPISPAPVRVLDEEHDLFYRERELEERHRELQERQAERARELVDRQYERVEHQGEMGERQREIEARMRERQEEMMERVRDRVRDRDRDRFVSGDEASEPELLRRRPPAPWLPGDPADSIYRAAREALNRGEYRKAAQLFSDVPKRFPGSAYVGDCGYWEAFARYRIGSTDELRVAAKVLDGISARAAAFSREVDVAGLRARINGVLAARGDRDAAALVERTAQQAGSTACDREDLMVRVEALNALSTMDPAGAAPLLRRVLDRRDECSEELRRRAVFILGRRADTTAAAMLVGVARADPSMTVRTEAIGWLPRLPGDAPLAALEEIIRTSDDERVQRAAVRALMSSESPRARTGMRALIERRDAPERLRLEAISALEKDRATADDAAYLRGLYGKLESERLREAIIGAVSRIGGKEDEEWLLALARNTGESSSLRAAAVARLVRANVTVADLAKLYDAADSYSVREQIVRVLGQRRENEATDKLFDIARNATDPGMRRMAIGYLQRRNDPRTTKMLTELITR